MANLDVNKLPHNLEIFDSYVKANSKIPRYDKIMCSISGGSDSDILLDIVTKLDDKGNVRYVFFDTGLEYAATKEHLKYLEEKYGITIEVQKAIKPIPMAVRQHGQPFLSKYVSQMIWRLQSHGFKWEDKSFDELYAEYPKCKSALQWWCNGRPDADGKFQNKNSKFNIARNKWLKEFMIANPPQFLISDKCCTYTKKKVAKKYKDDNAIQLSITGIRKSEGGIRSAAYQNCFSADVNGCDEYRPIFWYKDDTKRIYDDFYDIKHSRCYSEYGLTRTGCAGCPFGRDFEKELEIIREYEPKLYKAVNKIFKESYEYTRQYRKFVEEMEKSQC